MQEINVLSIDNFLGFLTITLAAKDHLPSRKVFFNKVKDVLRRSGELDDTMLQGLE